MKNVVSTLVAARSMIGVSLTKAETKRPEWVRCSQARSAPAMVSNMRVRRSATTLVPSQASDTVETQSAAARKVMTTNTSTGRT